MIGGVATTAEAVAASVACARELGLPADAPEVVAEGYSVRVRLSPAPVLTRVVTEGVRLRGDPTPWLEREVAAARHLAARGIPVVLPWSSAGPHSCCGLQVTLWQWVEELPGQVSQARLGAMLGELHAALADLDAGLPHLVGPLTDVTTALSLSDDVVLHRVADQVLPLARTWPQRPLHGDVHVGNLLLTPAGPLWIDLEDVCAGPVEWDLTSLTLTDEAVDAYPGDVDADRLRDCQDLRRLQVLAGLLTDDLNAPSLQHTVVAGLAHRL